MKKSPYMYIQNFALSLVLCSFLSFPLHTMEKDEYRLTPVIGRNADLLEDAPVNEKAWDMDYFETAHKLIQGNDFAFIYGFAGIAFRDLNISGFGASLIVYDCNVIVDNATNILLLDTENSKDKKGNENHANIVSAVAASRHKNNDSLAYGSFVYPIPFRLALLLEKRVALLNKKLSLNNQKLDIEMKQLENAKLIESLLRRTYPVSGSNPLANDEDGLSSKLSELKQEEQRLAVAHTRAVNEERGAAEDHNSNEEKIRQMTEVDPLSFEMLDKIEGIISHCQNEKKPVPHVINVSMKLHTKKAQLNEKATKLARILSSNDMLLVLSAGNETETLSHTAEIEGDSVDFRSCLFNFPELLSRTIIVGAFYGNWNTIADFSNLPGAYKDHGIIAYGGTRAFRNGKQLIFLSSNLEEIICPDTCGTSFSAPRVAATAVLLRKYFPEAQLSMLQIKDIILRSASRPSDYSAVVHGMGILDPIQAWTEALKLAPRESEGIVRSIVNKIMGLFG